MLALALKLVARMVYRCVAAGCSNTPSDRVSLYKFPSDPSLREKWIKQVRRTRAQWTAAKYSVLCSDHFTADCFEANSAIAATFGISKKRRLKPDAVPTIFYRQLTTDQSTSEASAQPRPGVTGNLTPRYFGIPEPNILGYNAPPYHISLVYTVSPQEILHPRTIYP